MTEQLRKYLQRWFVKAEHDLITARTILEYRPFVLDIVCFHCQQAVEKYLKAFLLYNNQEVMKIHDVILLLKKCSELDKDFENIDLKNLNEFAVDVRYPDNFLMPELNEAKDYIIIAETIEELVKSKIK